MTAIEIIRDFESRPVSEWTYRGIRDAVAAFAARPLAERRAAIWHMVVDRWPGSASGVGLVDWLRNRWTNRLGSYQRCQTIFSQP